MNKIRKNTCNFLISSSSPLTLTLSNFSFKSIKLMVTGRDGLARGRGPLHLLWFTLLLFLWNMFLLFEYLQTLYYHYNIKVHKNNHIKLIHAVLIHNNFKSLGIQIYEMRGISHLSNKWIRIKTLSASWNYPCLMI